MLTRRDVLRGGGCATLGFGLNLLCPASLMRRLWANPPEDAKLVLIFQRGGNDGVNTLIPYGDPQYNVTNRPSLFIPRDEAIDLGNDFAGLHPRMAPMMDIYNHPDLNRTPGPGNLAVIHRVGYPDPSQSHFDSQQYWETAIPGDPAFDEGMFYRQVAYTMHPDENHLVAATISATQMVALKGQVAIPVIRDPAGFTFTESPSKVRKLLGSLPSTPEGPDGSGLLGAYGGPRDFPDKPYRDLVYGTGLTLADAMNVVQAAVAQGPYVPSPTALYPEGSFGEKLRHVAMLLRRTDVRVLGLNIGGWDTHTNQGQISGYHGNLLGQVAQGFQALYRDLQEQWDRLVIVTMTEFGRTSRENGSRGTDHAHACVMFVAGGGVRGGVYNCDAATWQSGDLFSSQDRYVRRRTDFRAIFGEILTRHFGDDQATLEAVIPGYSRAAQDNPSDFTPLNLLH